jgi:hypothetical protein
MALCIMEILLKDGSVYVREFIEGEENNAKAVSKSAAKKKKGFK